MFWAFLSVLAGLGDAVSFAIIKKLNKIDLYARLTCFNLMIFLFLLVRFLFYDVPEVSLKFFVVVAINAVVWLIAMLLLIKALQKSNLSASIPMLSFTPVFLLFASYLLLKEFPDFSGLLGVIIVVIGSWVLNIFSLKYGFFEPFKAIFKNKGVFYMLIVAFLFSITASLSKIAINLSNPGYFIFVHYLITSIILALLFLKRVKNSKKQIKKNSKYFLVYGISGALSELSAATAIQFALVPYVISLKRSSIIFSVILGFFLFKEKNFKQALIGAFIMFIGVILIMLP